MPLNYEAIAHRAVNFPAHADPIVLPIADSTVSDGKGCIQPPRLQREKGPPINGPLMPKTEEISPSFVFEITHDPLTAQSILALMH